VRSRVFKSVAYSVDGTQLEELIVKLAVKLTIKRERSLLTCRLVGFDAC
jgi:hypothetical protein